MRKNGIESTNLDLTNKIVVKYDGMGIQWGMCLLSIYIYIICVCILVVPPSYVSRFMTAINYVHTPTLTRKLLQL